MTGGTEFQEAAEAPQEIREVSEVKEQLDRAAFEPEAAAERFSDIKQAEDVREAFVAAVQVVKTPPTETSLDGKTHDPGDHYSGVEMTQGEVLEDNDLNAGPSQSVATDVASQQAAQVQEVGQPDQKSSERISEEKTDTAKTELTKHDGSTAQKESDSQIEEKAGETSGAALPDESPPESPFTELVSDLDDTATDIPVVDSEDSPVKLTEVSSSSDTENFSQDMVGAKPGEVRGFVNDQEDNPYILEVTGETGENSENQIVIPTGNNQIDFTGAVREVNKVDSFTWKLTVTKEETGDFRVPTKHPTKIEPLPDRDPSGEYLETPGDASDLEMNQQEDPPAYDPDLKPEKVGENQQESSDRKASTREEILTLQDELSDWPDGEPREITYNDWVKQADGSYVKVEITVKLTKEEAETLLDRMQENLSDRGPEGSSSGSTILEYADRFELDTGSILVDSADIPIIQTDEVPSESSSQQEGVGGVNELIEQARMLENEIKRLLNVMKEMLPGVGQEVTYTTLEKTGELSFEPVEVTSTVNFDGLFEIIQELEHLQLSILVMVKSNTESYVSEQTGPGIASSENTPQLTYTGGNAGSGESNQPELGQPVKQQNLNSNQDSDDSGSLAGRDTDSSLN